MSRRFWIITAVFLVGGTWGLDRLLPVDLTPAPQTQVVVDATGQPLRQFADDNGVWRYPVKQEQVSERYLQALLQYEDRYFYYHPGVNPFALVRAVYQWIVNGDVISGGSTLTMQVARLRYPGLRGWSGKWLQIVRAMQIEWHYSKRDILDYYLNHAPFGGPLEGVEAASRRYFGYSADKLTWGQAALLAGLPQAPSLYRPDKHPKRAEQQRNKVLERLGTFGVLTLEQVEQSKDEGIRPPPVSSPTLTPLLARRLHSENTTPVAQTFIQRRPQLAVSQLVKSLRSQLPDGASVAILVMDEEGKVVVYQGSAGIDAPQRFGYVDMVRALRSPGSTLKPFVYGVALDQGLIHSQSLLLDVPLRFGDYQPQNFQAGFSGPVSVEQALRESLNVPAVQVLERIGARAFFARLRSSGAHLSLPSGAHPNLAMVLGGISTSLEDLVRLYSSLNHQGVSLAPRFTPTDPVIRRPLLSPESSWIVRRMLPQASLGNGIHLAYKTGTSSAFRDSWAIGLSAGYTIGVWVGRPDNGTLVGHIGASTAVPLLKSVASLLDLKSWPSEKPQGVTLEPICWPGGQPAPVSLCDETRHAWVINKTFPRTWMDTVSGASGIEMAAIRFHQALDSGLRVPLGCSLATSQQILPLWPAPLQPWLPKQHKNANRLPALDARCNPNKDMVFQDGLRIIGLENGDHIKPHLSTTMAPRIKALAVGGLPDWYWFLDGKLLENRTSQLILEIPTAGEHQLVVTDRLGASDQVLFVVEDESTKP